ncbi:MAG TPA: hypothetical protein VGM11_06300 [Acidobacteriaceae bacterium]
MKRCLFALLLFLPLSARAQAKPHGACPFVGFEDDSHGQPNLAEVATKAPAPTWLACDSPKGCASLTVEPGSPVQIYSTDGEWTCGYSEDRHGAGATWFRSRDLRPVKFSLDPPMNAWYGVWKGGEDRVVISPARDGKGLHLKGNAVWHGLNGNDHFGHIQGDAAPTGNRLHYVDDGCVVNLTLAGRFILASDNQGCGGMNARFGGFWTRSFASSATKPSPRTTVSR